MAGVRKENFRTGCDVPGCERAHYGKGFCRKHWERNKNNGDPLKVRTTHHLSLPERLQLHGKWNAGCFEWQRRLDKYGYGQVTVNGTPRPVSRVAYEVAYGDIPAGLVVRHKCDNPKCYNLDYLELGTHADNQADKVKRNRSAYGVKNASAKLNDDKVLEIVRLAADGVRTAELASIFSVGTTTIRRIVRGESWCHVTR